MRFLRCSFYDWWAAKASKNGMSNSTGSHAFFVYATIREPIVEEIIKHIKMKTKFFLLVALIVLLPACATAQFYNVKKVAITEIVDRSSDGDVSEGTKTFIRSALTDAITNSEGYEGYTTISFTTLDVNFDRTGNISSATLTYVKKQMMDYILVSEVIPLDKKTVLLSARIVRSSDGKIVASSSQRTYADIDYLRGACNSLAYKLVGAI